MAEKMEQSKEFIREISILTNRNMWLNIAMEHIYKSEKSFPVLYKYIFCDGFQDSIANQLTFAKIWAGEIELVEKKPNCYVLKQLHFGGYVYFIFDIDNCISRHTFNIEEATKFSKEEYPLYKNSFMEVEEVVE